MKRPLVKRIVLKICKRLAWIFGLCINPITVLRWTGIFPFRTTSFLKFSPIHFHDQAAFNESKPLSYNGEELLTLPPSNNVLISHMLELEQGIATQGGYVFDKEGELISEASHKYREQHSWAHVTRPFSLFPNIKKFNCEVAILTASNHQVYWHWLFEVLPRIAMLERTKKIPEKFYLQNSYSFQRESLELLGGVPKEAIIDCEQVPLISASKLLVPCLQVIGSYPKWICQFLRDRFLPHAIKDESIEPTRIYISRENAQHRKVQNEPEIIEFLKSYGIVSVRLEELSFGEQLRLFYNAELVIGPHGSGLGNIVFCSKGTQVIELFPATTIDAFFKLSKELELDYYFLRARNGQTKDFGHVNYSFNLDEIVNTLEFVGVSPR